MSNHAILKAIISKFFWGFIKENEMTDLFSNYKPKYDDDVMECLQFGICSTRTAPPREIPYFHFW